MPEIPRRDFLKLITTTLLTACGLLGLDTVIRFLHSPTNSPPQTVFDIGAALEYPVGTRTLLPQIPVVLIHDENGFSALSLICSHLGCTVEKKADGFICPCHGSHFGENGKVLRGPAGKELRSLRVETTPDGQLHLFLN
ncbi:MAG: Rieske 2Fe-2S domain-containing protein [Chloroflexi bacterium]|nr:Rieske 2Fe-2S domain-containing protein [Chloroflexota bacterium]